MFKLRGSHGFEACFAVSLHPEIFHALQVLADPAEVGFGVWRDHSLEAFPLRDWSLDLPSGMWPAAADILTIEPTQELPVLIAALNEIDTPALQRRFLAGLLHVDRAVAALVDEGQDPTTVIGRMPRSKRDWLAFVGLYPLEAKSPATRALARMIDDPDGFRTDLVATLRDFWDATFSQTWSRLVPRFEESVREKSRLFGTLSLAEFLRHTLLPVEFDAPRQTLRALRGGYQLPVVAMGTCTFTPSVFNARRLWTVRGQSGETKPWFPYMEPDLRLPFAEDEADRCESAADVALIFRALGDATRFAMASLIGQHPRTSVELATILSVTKPTVSHHIHILRSAGLIHEVEHGGCVLISLRRQQIARISELALDRIFEPRDAIDLVRSRRER